jgi:hypothetical protein
MMRNKKQSRVRKHLIDNLNLLKKRGGSGYKEALIISCVK